LPENQQPEIMENQINDNRLSGQEPGQHHRVNQSDSIDLGHTVGLKYDEAKKELNSKILKLTMTIMDHYPELTNFLEEMPVTIPNEIDPRMTLKHLKTYYESLNSILNNYKLDHPSAGIIKEKK
jgi:hypothetical protein